MVTSVKSFGIMSSVLAGTLAASCAPVLPPAEAVPPPTMEFSECPVIASRGWKAWINAMPGPGAVRTLYITGEIDLPTPGFTVTLVPGPADRMMPPGQRFALDAVPPGGMTTQVVTATPVRYGGPATYQTYRSITIGCGGRVLAEIDKIETAY